MIYRYCLFILLFFELVALSDGRAVSMESVEEVDLSCGVIPVSKIYEYVVSPTQSDVQLL